MGVGSDFNKRLRQFGANENNLSDLANKTLALDISTEYYAALRSKAVSDQFHAQPSVPVSTILKHFMKILDCCKRFDIKLKCVHDGLRHPGKARVDAIRKAEKDTNAAKLSALYASGRAADYNEVMSLRKQCVYPRSDVIAEVVLYLRSQNVDGDVEVLQAPFEADFQCYYFEKTGIVDGVITTDGDLFVFGTQNSLWMSSGTRKMIHLAPSL